MDTWRRGTTAGATEGGRLSACCGISMQGFHDTLVLSIAPGGLFFQEAPDSAQDGGIHGGRNSAGLRVLLAGVINTE
jgi:hypothetical protein